MSKKVIDSTPMGTYLVLADPEKVDERILTEKQWTEKQEEYYDKFKKTPPQDPELLEMEMNKVNAQTEDDGDDTEGNVSEEVDDDGDDTEASEVENSGEEATEEEANESVSRSGSRNVPARRDSQHTMMRNDGYIGSYSNAEAAKTTKSPRVVNGKPSSNDSSKAKKQKDVHGEALNDKEDLQKQYYKNKVDRRKELYDKFMIQSDNIDRNRIIELILKASPEAKRELLMELPTPHLELLEQNLRVGNRVDSYRKSTIKTFSGFVGIAEKILSHTDYPLLDGAATALSAELGAEEHRENWETAYYDSRARGGYSSGKSALVWAALKGPAMSVCMNAAATIGPLIGRWTNSKKYREQQEREKRKGSKQKNDDSDTDEDDDGKDNANNPKTSKPSGNNSDSDEDDHDPGSNYNMDGYVDHEHDEYVESHLEDLKKEESENISRDSPVKAAKEKTIRPIPSRPIISPRVDDLRPLSATLGRRSNTNTPSIREIDSLSRSPSVMSHSPRF